MEVSSQLDIPAVLLAGKTFSLVNNVEGLESRLLLADDDKIPSLWKWNLDCLGLNQSLKWLSCYK
jgi:hypothetical protein